MVQLEVKAVVWDVHAGATSPHPWERSGWVTNTCTEDPLAKAHFHCVTDWL